MLKVEIALGSWEMFMLCWMSHRICKAEHG